MGRWAANGVITLGVMVAVVCLNAGTSVRAASAAVPPVLAMKPVRGLVTSDRRYLYVGAPSARSATVWDSQTGRTARIALPAGCGGIVPVLGSGVAFFVCGIENVSAWAYVIADRRWLEVPERVIGGDCDSGPNGPENPEDINCSANGAGTRWVSWAAEPNCENCTDSAYSYYNLLTGQTVAPTGGGSGVFFRCLLIAGCDNLDAARLNLDPVARPCRPLPGNDYYQPLAAGWIALEPPSQSALSLGRCGSSQLRRLSIATVTTLVSGPDVLWEPNASEARVYNAELNRSFTLPITAGSVLDLEGMVGDRVYGEGDSDSADDFFIGTLPAPVSAFR